MKTQSKQRQTKQRQERAAQMIAEGRYQYAEIADKVGIEVRTLHYWRNLRPFMLRVEELSSDFQKRAWDLGLARKYHRITCLANIHSKLLAVIEKRAEDPDMQLVPGGNTGLLVKTYKVSGDTVMTEYAVDTGLIRELRAVQEQAAKELGQLVEKRETKISLKDMTDEQLDAFIADLGEEDDD
jgi:hypothetical protein